MAVSNIDLIRTWMQDNNSSANFPPTFENEMIERFLYVCEGDLNRTKEVLQLFFQFRKSTPEFFTNRDPLTKGQQSMFETVCVYPLPKKTEKGYQVYVTHFLNQNADKFDFLEYCKMFFNISDVRMKTEEKIPKGDIPVFDMSGFTLKHLMKLIFSLTLFKKYMKFTQEAHPVYLKQIHIVNTSSILEKVLNFIRPLMREEVKHMIHFHAEGSDTIFDYISKDILPVELGGKGTSINDMRTQWQKKVENEREWLMTNPWRYETDTNSSQNSFKIKSSGNFSSLDLD